MVPLIGSPTSTTDRADRVLHDVSWRSIAGVLSTQAQAGLSVILTGRFFVWFNAQLIPGGVGEVFGRCHPTRLRVGGKFTIYSLANNQNLESRRVFEVGQMIVS